jgi:hypothetical protein
LRQEPSFDDESKTTLCAQTENRHRLICRAGLFLFRVHIETFASSALKESRRTRCLFGQEQLGFRNRFMIPSLEFGILLIVQILDGFQDIRGIRFVGCMHMFFQFVSLEQRNAFVHPTGDTSKATSPTTVCMAIAFKNPSLLKGHCLLEFSNHIFSQLQWNCWERHSNKVTAEENVNKDLYDTFGVTDYHARNVFGNNVSIYIIDTGLQLNQDLANVIVEDFSGTLGSTSSHGSAVAALVSAPRNEYGIVGIAPEATVYLADVDDSNSNIWDSYVAQALYSAYLRNVDIISISLSTATPSPLMHNAIQLCVDAGILVFAAAGNSGRTVYEYPASFPGVISVASCSLSKTWSSFNTRNDHISVVAPGEGWKLPTQTGLQVFSGTSFACPFAAAMAALDLSERRPRNDLRTKPRIIQDLNFTFKTTQLVPQSTSSSLTFGPASAVFLAIVAIAFFVLVSKWRFKKRTNVEVL